VTGANLAASVRQRLLNIAKRTNRPFQEVLQYYAMERFLFRLAQSPHNRAFTLKGGLLLHAWDAPRARVTKDVDLLARMGNSLEAVTGVIRSICEVAVESDGMTFDSSSLIAQRIKEDADYEGVRLTFVAYLDVARVTMQLDIGFGDTITPASTMVTYPTLLTFAAPVLTAYPRETVIAEKFHAMVYLGTANSRMKDFYDVWMLARTFAFDGDSLAAAIASTFANRKTAVEVVPLAFTAVFTEQAATRMQWAAFAKRTNLQAAPASLAEATVAVSSFIAPVAESLLAGTPFAMAWAPGGPWLNI